MFRYARLGGVALNVSDVDRSARFLAGVVGLEPAGRGPRGEALLRCSDGPYDVLLRQDEPAGLAAVSWEMESELDVARVAEAVAAQGLAVEERDRAECLALARGRCVRMIDPYSTAAFEFFSAAPRPTPALPFRPSLAKILRLGHVVLKVAHPREAVRFYTEVLNFRVSDSVDGLVTFLRCFPNPLHHSLGVTSGSGPGLHHVNFMVSEIDDIGRALVRFRKEGVPIVFGPGRHPPSESVFLYFLDPDGLTLEYSFGMEEFPESAPRPPRILPAGLASIDHWGNVPDPRFAAHGSIRADSGLRGALA
jgi:2,3-dihydroxy-p-cumate/2,3-dihydroxybenzoate 3,4-dioxygenase